MWSIILQLVWKIIKDPKLLVILIFSILLIGLTVKGYWYKQKINYLETKLSNLNIQIKNLEEINKKVTQNRDALAQQLENYKEIDSKYKNLQNRINALQKICAKPVKPVVVKPSGPTSTIKPKPIETTTEDTINPGGVITTPLLEPIKPKEPESVGGEGVKIKTSETEYQYGGEEYEREAKSIYNSIVFWFNSNSISRLQPKSPTYSVPNTEMCLPSEAYFESFGCGQVFGSPGQLQYNIEEYERYC